MKVRFSPTALYPELSIENAGFPQIHHQRKIDTVNAKVPAASSKPGHCHPAPAVHGAQVSVRGRHPFDLKCNGFAVEAESLDCSENLPYYFYNTANLAKQRERLLEKSGERTTMKIDILLCDDDEAFLQRLERAVTRQPLPQNTTVAITKSSHPADLQDRQLSLFRIMFLDIDMAQRSGMDIARRVRELHLDTIIIFVTNYPQFSLEGYEVRAFRYLLKQEMEQKLPVYFRDALAEISRGEKGLHFSVDAESYYVPYSDIIYMGSDQRVIYLYTVKPLRSGDHFYGKMEDLARELEPEGFLRIQKSYLVNMAHIKKLNYDHVILSNGKELSVSRKGYSQIKIQYLAWKNRQWGTSQ